MRTRSILILATIAIAIVMLTPISLASSLYYGTYNTQSELIPGFQVHWDSVSEWLYPYYYDSLNWQVLFYHQDAATGGINPRLNYDSSGSTTGNNIPGTTLTYGQYTWLSASSTVAVHSGSYHINNYATYHKVAYPNNNAIGTDTNKNYQVQG